MTSSPSWHHRHRTVAPSYNCHPIIEPLNHRRRHRTIASSRHHHRVISPLTLAAGLQLHRSKLRFTLECSLSILSKIGKTTFNVFDEVENMESLRMDDCQQTIRRDLVIFSAHVS